ncbi:MAG: response regulator transcription factor [Epsilonproteobacteria bacterium]|nr:response regulator transcription factor [Campylobacterota bacterium]
MYPYLKDKRLLFVEDEPDVLANIASLLESFFARIHTATTAEEGWRIFSEEAIDALLVDIELPGMNGIGLIKKIRRHHPDLPIVVISAYTRTDYLLESVELRLDKYIVKPLTTRKLYELLERLNADFSPGWLELGEGVALDEAAGKVHYGSTAQELTRKECRFLAMLYRSRIVDYERLYALWEDEVPSENAVRSFIKHLRKKLPAGFLKNRSGVGYYVGTV